MNRFTKRTSRMGTPYRDWFVDNIGCPTCGKNVGERCVMVNTSHLKRIGLREYPYGTTTHKRRKDAAKSLYLLGQIDRDRYFVVLDLATA